MNIANVTKTLSEKNSKATTAQLIVQKLTPRLLALVLSFAVLALTIVIGATVWMGGDVEVKNGSVSFNSSKQLNDKINEFIQREKESTAKIDFYQKELENYKNSIKQDYILKPKRILVMDSDLKVNVYNPRRGRLGGSNAEEILSIIAVMPNLMFQSELIKPAWSGHDRIITDPPDLIIVHHSSFSDSEGLNRYEELLINFLQVIINSTSTKIIIYSRKAEFMDEGKIVSKFYNKLPGLKQRLKTIHIPQPNYFMDPVVKNKLREKVRSLLHK